MLLSKSVKQMGLEHVLIFQSCLSIENFIQIPIYCFMWHAPLNIWSDNCTKVKVHENKEGMVSKQSISMSSKMKNEQVVKTPICKQK